MVQRSKNEVISNDYISFNLTEGQIGSTFHNILIPMNPLKLSKSKLIGDEYFEYQKWINLNIPKQLKISQLGLRFNQTGTYK